jgi:mannose-6-phosphate isomerase-like protein (cupin superfamily)
MRVNTSRVVFLFLLLLASSISAAAQERGRGTPPPLSTDPYNIWPAKQLSTPGRLGNYGHYSASIQRRDVGAAPETHTGFSHFLMFTSGEGNVILGGQIVDGPDGKKIIKGGDTHKIVLGEMYHIPINTPHQVVPNPGSSVTYWVTNINVLKP